MVQHAATSRRASSSSLSSSGRRRSSCAATTTPASRQDSNFLTKLFIHLQMVPAPKDIRWSSDGKSLIIDDLSIFCKNSLAIAFPNQADHTSFFRQMTLYGFSRVKTKVGDDEGRADFEHPLFNRKSTIAELLTFKRRANPKRRGAVAARKTVASHKRARGPYAVWQGRRPSIDELSEGPSSHSESNADESPDSGIDVESSSSSSQTDDDSATDDCEDDISDNDDDDKALSFPSNNSWALPTSLIRVSSNTTATGSFNPTLFGFADFSVPSAEQISPSLPFPSLEAMTLSLPRRIPSLDLSACSLNSFGSQSSSSASSPPPSPVSPASPLIPFNNKHRSMPYIRGASFSSVRSTASWIKDGFQLLELERPDVWTRIGSAALDLARPASAPKPSFYGSEHESLVHRRRSASASNLLLGQYSSHPAAKEQLLTRKRTFSMSESFHDERHPSFASFARGGQLHVTPAMPLHKAAATVSRYTSSPLGQSYSMPSLSPDQPPVGYGRHLRLVLRHEQQDNLKMEEPMTRAAKRVRSCAGLGEQFQWC